MAERPYTLLSCGISLDGYLDDGTGERLLLSNEQDLERVDGARACCDAILVGAATVRNDNPRLVVRSEAHRAERIARGAVPSPLKVAVSGSGDLDPHGAFFADDGTEKLVYCASAVAEAAQARLGRRATVVPGGDPVDVGWLSADLATRGVGSLMVEGGGEILTQFLVADLVDELQLVIAPVFVGDSRACRFVGDGAFPWNRERRARLAETRQIGDVVLLRYALSERFRDAPDA